MINQANENPAPLNREPDITNPTQKKLYALTAFHQTTKPSCPAWGFTFGHAPKSSTKAETESFILEHTSLEHQLFGLFSRNFSDPSNAIRARGLIRKLRQGTRSVATYAAEFRTLAKDSGYDQLALVDQFLRGLKDNVMNLMIMNDLPKDLEGKISIAIRVDNRLASHSMLRQGNPDFFPRQYTGINNNAKIYGPAAPAAPEIDQNAPGTPMEVDAITSKFQPPLSQQEKQRRRDLRLCLYCSQPGHIADSCTAKSSSGKVQSQLASHSMLRQGNPDFFPRQYTGINNNAKIYGPAAPAAPEIDQNAPGTPMEVDAITSKFQPPLSQQEKQRRRDLRLCLYCSQPGHIADSCTAKSSSGKVQSQ
ncbi:Retrotransposon-derived protein PEG10 [Smittium mucronatum]|uniref:Retrotransposon-derived protein PEG10 n=1 Tax=Smittium mucronatum TaxID=133383 RepID=A0A1R0H5I1_9FUNG|nr:Retrotransposon-derived protein PEG10 [Smittium mucronatum]